MTVCADSHRMKARAELAAAECAVSHCEGVPWSGDVFAEVALVKGEPGPAEVAGGAALSGPDGAAAAKALQALGFDPGLVFSTVARACSHAPPEEVARRLRAQIEVVDPYIVIALDPAGAEAVRDAFGLQDLHCGRVSRSMGRIFVALEGLEESLIDEARKRRVWGQLKVARPRPPSL